MPCPIATLLTIYYPDEQAATAKAGFKFMRTTSLANSQSAKFTPQVRDQSREWEYVQDQLRPGQKLVRVFYGVMMVTSCGEGDLMDSTLKAANKQISSSSGKGK